MRMVRHAATLLAASFPLSVAASADVIISNFSAGLGTGTVFGINAFTQYKAFGFTMPATPYVLDDVVLSLNVTDPAANPVLEVWSDAGGSPGVPLFQLDTPGALGGQMDYVFPASSQFVLSASTSYWIYLVSDPVAGPEFFWDGSSPATLPSGVATALNYEFNGNPSSFFNRLEINGTPGMGTLGTAYCDPAVPNSTGASGVLEADGSAFVSDNDVTLMASDLPPNAFGFFLASRAQGFVAMPGGSQGNLCLSGQIGRYVGPGQIQNSGPAGAFQLTIDLTMVPQPMGFVSVMPGQDWNFQAWHRDAVMGNATSNFTNGLEISFM